MDSYATVGQLKTWLGLASDQPDPTNAAAKLRSATILIAVATNVSPYDPVPSQNVQPLQDATCAQAAEWVRLGIEPGALAPGSGAVKRSSMLGDVVERDTAGDTTRLAEAGECLAPEARAILLAAGLLWLPTAMGDAAPYLLDYGLGYGPLDACGGYPPSGYWWGSEACLWP
jgi:hypothetical protein